MKRLNDRVEQTKSPLHQYGIFLHLELEAHFPPHQSFARGERPKSLPVLRLFERGVRCLSSTEISLRGKLGIEDNLRFHNFIHDRAVDVKS